VLISPGSSAVPPCVKLPPSLTSAANDLEVKKLPRTGWSSGGFASHPFKLFAFSSLLISDRRFNRIIQQTFKKFALNSWQRMLVSGHLPDETQSYFELSKIAFRLNAQSHFFEQDKCQILIARGKNRSWSSVLL
jgi:hypothetical protein